VVTPIKAGAPGESSFKLFTGMKSVSGKNITTVEVCAFYDCASLETVELSKAASIGELAFVDGAILGSVNLPSVAMSDRLAFGGTGATDLTFTPGATPPNVETVCSSVLTAPRTLR
jgi:hypothetical protein